MNPLTRVWLQLRLIKAAFTLVKDPNALDKVFHIADSLASTQRPMLEEICAEARQHEQGLSALKDLPRVGQVKVDALLAYAPGTLGRAFGEFLKQRNLDPAALPVRPANDGIEYAMAHLYETHDVWHVVTGFETDVAGELGLQAFYAAQVPGKLPVALLAIGFMNAFLFAFDDRKRRLDAITRGWLMGKAARPFFGYRWADKWELPLAVVKRELGVDPVPAAAPGLLPAVA